jgi:hypothetical protein
MEIIINRCYGGMGFSPLAHHEYAKRKGYQVFFYKQTGYKHNGNEEYRQMTLEEAQNFKGFLNILKKDYGQVINHMADNENYIFLDRDEIRTDKDMIEIVKELKEKANGQHALLDIVDIPDDVEYEINEYDGVESVHEKHRSW